MANLSQQKRQRMLEFLQRLREEKEAKLSGGLYNELQVRITYNSNHMI